MIRDAPTVSIGMPIHNGGIWLADSIESILNQTYSDLELVITDNASTDNSEEICRSYAAQDSRVRYIRHNTNIGGPNNYNSAFHHTSSPYFKWASCNDICQKEMIERCIEVLLARKDVVLSYPKTRLLLEETNTTEDYEDNLDLQDESACSRFKKLLQKIRLNNAMNGIFRSEVLKNTPLMKLHVAEDINLMAELTLYGKFVEIPEYLFYRRMGSNADRKTMTKEEIFDHYDPNKLDGMYFQRWKINADYFSAAYRSPISINEKLCVYRYLLRVLNWDKRALFNDLLDIFKSGKQKKSQNT